MKPNETDIAILRAFRERDYRRSDLSRAHPELGDVGRNLDRLYAQCYLNRDVPPVNQGAVYMLATKGRRLLDRIEREGSMQMGEIAKPRQIDRLGGPNYTGSTFIPPRQGSMRAYELPSLGADGEPVERRRPMLIGSNPDPRYRVLP